MSSVKNKRIIMAWVLLIGSVVAWPLTALTVFRQEPQGILGLSWGAIILTSLDVLMTANAKEGDSKD